VALYPVKYHFLRYNFDSLWVAALNYLHTTGAVFGKDIELMYGPLAYLDAWDAEFVRDPKRPEFVPFQWLPIDERHPLLDCPQTALALYQNYEFDSMYGGLMVLRARAEPLSATMHFVRQTTMKLGQPLRLSEEHDPVIRIFLNYNLCGRLAEFFFRIPPVYATLSGPNGRTIIHRIPPAVLSGGVPLGMMPADLEDARRLFAAGRTAAAFDSIALSGPGMADFAPTARVDVYESSGPTGSSDKR